MRVEDGTRVGGVAAAGEAQVLTHCLADDLSAPIQNARHEGCVDIGYVALEDARSVHHGNPGYADVVLDGDLLAGKRPGRCALYGALPVPSIETVFRSGRTITWVPPVLNRERRLGELVQATIRGQHAVHEVAEGCEIVLAQFQTIGSGNSLQ